MKEKDFNQVYFHDCVRQFLDAVGQKFTIVSVFTCLDFPNNVVLLMQYVPFTLKEYLDDYNLYGMVFTCSANPCGLSPYSYLEVVLTLGDKKFNS